MSDFLQHNNVISTEGLNLLQSTLNEWCAVRHLRITDPAARDAAGQLIDAYQFGIKEKDQLARLIGLS